jgi:hypothetical protein
MSAALDFVDVDDDVDFCSECQRVVLDGMEHDHDAHLSTLTQALELKEWRDQMQETGAHHLVWI